MTTYRLAKPLLFALGATLFISSCVKDSLTPDSGDSTLITNVEEHLSFVEGETGIPDRLEFVNMPIILTDTTLGRANCQKSSLWAHVAEIATLKYGSESLSATHVTMAGDLALVSYHLRGSNHKGAVEVVDLSNPDRPKITSQAFFLQGDVNAITVQQSPTGNSRKVWVAISDAKNGAVLAELSLKNKKFENNYYRLVKLAYKLSGDVSAAANSIAEAGDYLYVTCGKANGGVFCLKASDLSVLGWKQFPNAKGVASNGQLVACLQVGESSNLFVEQVGKFDFGTSYPLGKIVHQNVEDPLDGKVAMSFDAAGKNLYVTTGASGLRVFDPETGAEVFKSPTEMLASGNSNGVTLNGNYAYVANGADGMAIFELDDNQLPDESHVFLWDMAEQGASANFVQSKGDWVFVAKGIGGFKILKKPAPSDLLSLCGFDGQGTPNCLAPDAAICPNIKTKLDAELPVDGNVKTQHPAYLTSGVSEILLTEDTEVELRFLEENTTSTHAIGYYFYPADCPPASKNELVGLVAFPNFSKNGSGGGLLSGNSIKLPGKLRANTKIGFFMVQKGWAGSKIGSGQGLLYTNKAHNSNSKPQGLIFHVNDCGAIVVAFDQDVASSAKADFRDAVFQVKLGSDTATDIHDFIQL